MFKIIGDNVKFDEVLKEPWGVFTSWGCNYILSRDYLISWFFRYARFGQYAISSSRQCIRGGVKVIFFELEASLKEYRDLNAF